MITPRTTRLLRTANLEGCRRALLALAAEGPPLSARDRLVIVPTRAAAALVIGALERQALPARAACLHPEFITAGELPARFAQRLRPAPARPRPEAREVLMGVAARLAIDAGHPPPFALRPGLVAEMLRFYDRLSRNRRDIAAFERLTLGQLEPGADSDRGAERLVRQTRFLVEAFTRFEQLAAAHGLTDDRTLRAAALGTPAPTPWRHVVIAVGDDSRDRHGLCAADWDLLTRVPGLERVDVVVTDRMLAGAWHEHLHQLLPDLEEVRVDGPARTPPVLRVPSDHGADGGRQPAHPRAWTARDREDEVAGFARWVRALHRHDPSVAAERLALVVRQPLPYLYLAREVLRSANVPCQTFDALPLAGEPYAAALDLICSAVTTNLARGSVVALLRSPHLQWTAGEAVSLASVAAADVVLSEAGYLGGLEALERLAASARRAASGRAVIARPALDALVAAGGELAPLAHDRPAADHLDTLLTFLDAHDAPIGGDAEVASRQRRARAAIKGILTVLRDDFRELDDRPVDVDRVIAIVRRWIEVHTFRPHTGAGVHIVDAESARFGEFDHVQLAGLVESEWPERPSRDIFYGTAVLRDLGWPAPAESVEQARAAFIDLLHLPSRSVTVSSFSLEDDAPVSASPLLDELHGVRDPVTDTSGEHVRIFETDTLAVAPVALDGLSSAAGDAAMLRLARLPGEDPRFHGLTHGHAAAAFSLSALERYQDCPFKFFAADVLGLAEIPEDEPFLSPRARGRFVHEVFERFFLAWDGPGVRTITVENMDAARALFDQVAVPLLSALNESDAALERARLFGSAVAPGLVDIVLSLEACRRDTVQSRWLERRFDGVFTLGDAAGPGVTLRGVADRVDLLDGHRLRVIDYKTGQAPSVQRALQVPVYALCAQEQLAGADGVPWQVAEASYIAFSGKRAVVDVIAAGDDAAPVLAAARGRLLAVVEGIGAGAFPPQPHDKLLCRTCAYPAVCRKDYRDVHA